MKRGVALVGALVTLIGLVAGCSHGSAPEEPSPSGGEVADASSPSGGTAGNDRLSGSLTVFAAASLKVGFDRLRTEFQHRYPGVDFREITYNGSSSLATQIENGAPADIFASANEENMDKVAKLVTGRVDFATNKLQIAVAPGNPMGIHSLADLAKPDVVTVMCASEVPCGAAAHRALDAAGVELTPASEEQSVTAVVTKVETGNADAGLVYSTDVNTSDGKVDGIDFPEASQAVNTYPIAIIAGTAHEAAARAFLALVTGPAGQQVLGSVGFGAP